LKIINIYSDDCNIYTVDERALFQGELRVSDEEYEWVIKVIKEWEKVQHFIHNKF